VRHRGTAAFTLVELLVVIAIVGAITATLIAGLRSSKGAKLQNAQATLANVLTSARISALGNGTRVRVLIHADTRNMTRFRRLVAVQKEVGYMSDQWSEALYVVALPEGTIVLPHENRIPSGLYENGSLWMKTYTPSSTSKALHSSALSGSEVNAAIGAAEIERWDVVQFTPNDTISFSQGDIVLAAATNRPPSEYTSSQSPVRAESPELVRGVSISTYGVVALINTRSGF